MAETALRPPDRWRVDVHDTLPSTQEAMRRELDGGRDVHGLVLRALAQSQGKGRQSRAWASGPGGSYQTAAVRDESGTLRSGIVPLAIAVGIAESFAAKGIPVRIKWPNDLYLPAGSPTVVAAGEPFPGKLGGILCQHARGHLLIGVGVNVRNEVPSGAAKLQSIEPDDVSDLVLAGIARGLTGVLTDTEITRRYAHFDLLLGRSVRVLEAERELLGEVLGIDGDGCLLLAMSDRKVERTRSGRIVEIDAAAS